MPRTSEDGDHTKKKTIFSQERETERVQKLRSEYVQLISKTPREKLVFLDESGLSIKMTRAYARSSIGKRVFGFIPGRWGENLTIIGAINSLRPTAMMTLQGAADGNAFMSYVEEILTPTLRRGHVVVMDNLSVHKVSGVREAVERTGATLVYLPPYSPDLNPIEKLWSKLKSIINRFEARTLEALEQAVTQALRSITEHDLQGWFNVCGY